MRGCSEVWYIDSSFIMKGLRCGSPDIGRVQSRNDHKGVCDKLLQWSPHWLTEKNLSKLIHVLLKRCHVINNQILFCSSYHSSKVCTIQQWIPCGKCYQFCWFLMGSCGHSGNKKHVKSSYRPERRCFSWSRALDKICWAYYTHWEPNFRRTAGSFRC